MEERPATASAVRELRQEVGRLRKRVEAHERLHEAATRTAAHEAAARRSSRRFYVAIAVSVLTSNLATVLIVAAAHAHA